MVQASSMPESERTSCSNALHGHAPLNAIAVVKSREGALLGEGVDISPVGVCLTSTRPLDVGQLCVLDLQVLSEPKRQVTVAGRVCFCVGVWATFRIGFSCSLSELFSSSVP